MPRTTYKIEADKIRKWGEIEDIMQSIRNEIGVESIIYTPISYNGTRYVIAKGKRMYVFKRGADGAYALVGQKMVGGRALMADESSVRECENVLREFMDRQRSPDRPVSVPNEKKWIVRRKDPVESFGPGFFMYNGEGEETMEEEEEEVDPQQGNTVFEHEGR